MDRSISWHSSNVSGGSAGGVSYFNNCLCTNDVWLNGGYDDIGVGSNGRHRPRCTDNAGAEMDVRYGHLNATGVGSTAWHGLIDVADVIVFTGRHGRINSIGVGLNTTRHRRTNNFVTSASDWAFGKGCSADETTSAEVIVIAGAYVLQRASGQSVL